VYGIINEGIIAKTFYLAQGVPIKTFDHYGYIGVICIPWAITISVWHAFHAFLYPILVTHFFFPAHRDQPWLTRRGAIWLAVPTVLICTLKFFTRSKERMAGQLPHFLLMLACMGFLVWLATEAAQTAELTGADSPFQIKPVGWGMASFPVMFILPVLLAGAKVYPLLFYGYFAVVIGLVLWWLRKRAAIPLVTCLLFAIGDNLMMLLWAMPGAMRRAGLQQLVADAILLLIFCLLLSRLRKQSGIHHESGASSTS
jgi:hypothetical protein